MAVNASCPGVSRKVIFLSVDLDTTYAPMCCVIPPASPVGYIGIADRIQKGCFTMVNVTHYADYRRSGYQYLLSSSSSSFRSSSITSTFSSCSQSTVKFHCDLFCLVKFNLLIYGYHCTLQEKLLYQLCRLYLHRLSQFTNGKLLRDCDRADRLLRFFLFWYRRLYRCGLLLLPFFCWERPFWFFSSLSSFSPFSTRLRSPRSVLFLLSFSSGLDSTGAFGIPAERPP